MDQDLARVQLIDESAAAIQANNVVAQLRQARCHDQADVPTADYGYIGNTGHGVSHTMGRICRNAVHSRVTTLIHLAPRSAENCWHGPEEDSQIEA